MKKYLPLLLLLTAGQFPETKSETPLLPVSAGLRKTPQYSPATPSSGASAKIAILYLPQ